ncbi:MAG: divergent polysaccharide deacetylase family protein [Marinobacter sp.]|nr:divergent polysaccharide deacetylase family protein [Marinobacter sp.]
MAGLFAPAAQAEQGTAVAPTIAIIIDDMGYDLEQGRRLIEMEQPLTLAFLPFRPYTRRLAHEAHSQGKEIMLHAPMANTKAIGLGAGGLDASMDQHTVTTVLRRSLQSIPHVRGVNNHMGSLLTQLQEPMTWIMEEIRQYPLYFVDSRTIASTVAERTAQAHDIPTLSRDVFLDHEQTEEYVDAQFQHLLAVARRRGSAIAIGHPYPVTVDYLARKLPELDEMGISIATVSGLWALRNNNEAMFAEGEKRPVTSGLAAKER